MGLIRQHERKALVNTSKLLGSNLPQARFRIAYDPLGIGLVPESRSVSLEASSSDKLFQESAWKERDYALLHASYRCLFSAESVGRHAARTASHGNIQSPLVPC